MKRLKAVEPIVTPDYVYPVKKLIISGHVDAWCQRPYPGHTSGCPNYGNADRCPPKAPAITDYFDMALPLYLVHSEFDLAGHQARMKAAHPKWSDRQCRCVLYWQPASRRQLKERAQYAMRLLGLDAIATVPEAMGVNVYSTAAFAGLKLERIRCLMTCRHVALIGSGKQKEQGRLF